MSVTHRPDRPDKTEELTKEVESGLRQKKPFCCFGKTLLFHNGNEVFHDFCVQIDLLHRLQGGTDCSVGGAFFG